MAETIDFEFRGAMSDLHALDFYEAGRFQYTAARLLVKLDQFRRSGRFTSKVTRDTNTTITLNAQRDGCFVISTAVPFLMAGGDAFLQANIGLMWSYVTDRVFKKPTDDNLREALSTQRDLIQAYDNNIRESGEVNRRTLDLLESSIGANNALTAEIRQLYERLIAERDRKNYLEAHGQSLERITPDQESRLIAMATPLLKEMGVAFRKSAEVLLVTANDNENPPRRISFVNREMAEEVELERIDPENVLLLVRIIQYNVETGWGKLRSQEFGLLGLNVPSDIKRRLQASILHEMNRQDSLVECRIVRNPQGIPIRLIIRSIRNIEALEQPQ